jgi:chaperonin GroEL (HSP60 family)
MKTVKMGSNVKQVSKNTDIEERLAALTTNAQAIRAIASAVKGTIGPKGLDTMLIDKYGEVVITNDGVTILDLMEVNHPAARMLINIARAQQEQIGDGTTTATILAGGLVAQGVEQVEKGVPVAKIIEGMRAGVQKALAFFQEYTRWVSGIEDPLLSQAALVAGRGHVDVAELVMEAAGLVGSAKLKDPYFKLEDMVLSRVGARNEVFPGIIVNKERVNRQMPAEVTGARVMVIDDALEPEELEEEALATESGFKRYLELQAEFQQNIQKIIDLEVKLLLIDRGMAAYAEDMLTDAGVMVLYRVTGKEWQRVAEHTGARALKRTGLKKDLCDLEKYCGYATRVYEDEKLAHVRVLGGRGKPLATILVGAATEEVVGERERITKDAVAALQAAIRGGVVPGGGTVELAAAGAVLEKRREMKGMAVYGLDCVVEALKQPFSQIVANSGFNPLEKLGDVLAAQETQQKVSLGIDCDTGELAEMYHLGVIDPTPVKTHALQAALEVAEAILRIDTIIKKKESRQLGMKQNGGVEQWD